MSTQWNYPDRRPESRIRGAFAALTSRLSLRRRLDAILVSALLALVAILAAPMVIAVLVGQQTGAFDPPIYQPLADERILNNVRDKLADNPLLDAVLHVDGQAYISQKGGTIHRYDPATHLWTEETIPLDQGLTDRDVVLLRSGCGADALSDRAAACPDRQSLWGVTAAGGLVRRSGSGWQVVVSDTSFVGLHDKPVEQDDLTAAAVSDDGRWVVLGTKEDGVGVYDNVGRTWLASGPALAGRLRSPTVDRIAWWGGRFWIGGPAGLAALGVDPVIVSLDPAGSQPGPVLDLDADASGSLWVLQQTPCSEGGNGCRWLGELQLPDQTFIERIRENAVYPSLALADFNYAQFTGNRLDLAGQAGIYSYDPVLHSWARRYGQPVLTVLPASGSTGFYFGTLGEAGRWDGSAVTTWPLAGQRIVALSAGQNSDLLALSEQGEVSLLRDGGAVDPVLSGAGSSLDPRRFTAAASIGDQVVLLGPDGLLVHDVTRRSYDELRAASLPVWLAGSDAQLVSGTDGIYALGSPDQRTTLVKRLTAAELDLLRSQPQTLGNPPLVRVDGTPAQTWSWGSAGLGILTAAGQVYRVTEQGASPFVGVAASDLDGVPLVDVASLDGGLVLAGQSQLWRYDAQQRALDRSLQLPPGVQVAEIAVAEGQVFARSEDNRLASASTASPAILLDSRAAISITDAALADALAVGSDWYLAGGGQVVRYDSQARQVAQSWVLPAADATISLRGSVAGLPVAQVGRQVYVGDSALGSPDAINLSLSADRIWVQHATENGNYLQGYPALDQEGDASLCFFRRPTTGPAAGRVLDARPLGSDLVAVTTEHGLQYYNLAARSWFTGTAGLAPDGGRLHTVGDKLLLTEETKDFMRLSFVATDPVSPASSCHDSINDDTRWSWTGRAVAVDEPGDRIAWLDDNGTVIEQVGDTSPRVRLPATSGPGGIDDLVHVFSVQDALVFTSKDAILTYRTDTREWQRVVILSAEQTLTDIDIEPLDDRLVVVARTEDGKVLTGGFTLTDSAVHLGAIRDAQPFVPLDKGDLPVLDAQQRGTLWTFVLPDRIAYYDPTARDWWDEVQLGAPDDTLVLGSVAGRAVASGNNGGTWWVATDERTIAPTRFARYDVRPGERTAVDADGNIWSLSTSADLAKCAMDYSALTYNCSSLDALVSLGSGKALAAFDWQGLVLFALPDGLQAYSTLQGGRSPLPPAAAAFRGATAARNIFDEFWLTNGRELLILSGAPASGLSARVVPGILEIAFDSYSWMWGRTAEGWWRWNGRDFVLPLGLQAEQGARIFVHEGGIATAVTRDGSVYWIDAIAHPDPARLPAGLQPEEVDDLIRASSGTWWVRSGRQLNALISTQCFHWPADRTDPQPPEPCLQPLGGVTLPAGFDGPAGPTIAGVATIGRGLADLLEIVAVDGTGLRIERDAQGHFAATPIQVPLPAAEGLVADTYQTHAALVRQLPGGAFAYNPPLELKIGATNELFLVRPSGTVLLAAQAALTVEPDTPLDAGWLRWDRAQARFLIESPQGQVAVRGADFISNGIPIFQNVDALLPGPGDRWYAANQAGVWSYARPELSLTDSSVTYQPVALALPITAAHGRFTTPAGDLPLGATALEPTPVELIFTLGDVVLRERPGEGQIRAWLKSGGTLLPALDDDGFIWDRNRRGLVYAGNELLLQSDAGIGPLTRLDDFDAGPDDAARGAGRLRYESGKGAYLQTDRGWFKREPTGWTLVTEDPAATRELLSAPLWTWRLQGGELFVDVAGQALGQLTSGPQGLGFSADQLLSAAAFDNQLFVATGAALEIASQPADLGALAAERGPALPAGMLHEMPGPDPSRGLYYRSAGKTLRWDAASRQFAAVTADQDPFVQRTLMDAGLLRLTWRQGRVEKQLAIDDGAGSRSWVTFNFTDGHFPFDIVTALAGRNDTLYVGSAAGLQVYAPANGLAFSALQGIYQLPGTPALTSIAQLTAPAGNPTGLIARGSDGCMEATGSGRFQPCADPAVPDFQARVDNAFWQWIVDKDGRVVGRYRDAAGGLAAETVTIAGGRFPHDRLDDVSVCNGRAFSLWDSGWISVYPGESLALDAGLRNYPLNGAGRLVCLAQPIGLAHVTAAAGLYYAGNDVRRWTSSGWEKVTDAEVKAQVVDSGERPRAYERGRLALVRDPGPAGWHFEQQTLAGQWVALAWDGGRLALDVPLNMLVVADRLWLATPAGFVDLVFDADGRPVLDPETFVVVREPAGDSGVCKITDMTFKSGQVLVRCNAERGKVYVGQLTGQAEAGIFTPADGDPFVEADLVDRETGGLWTWRMTGCEGGQPGALSAQWRGEDVEIVDGRFKFDTLTGLTLFTPGTVEIATSAFGWLQAPTADLDVLALERPAIADPPPATVEPQWVTETGGELKLCLTTTPSGGYVRLSAGGQLERTAGCPEALGTDALWRYLKQDGEIVIQATKAVGGDGRRVLRQGRFNEDLVLGPPTPVGTSYWLPTEAGVLRLGRDDDLPRQEIQVAPFAKLPDGTVPQAVFAWEPDELVYVGEDGLHKLDTGRDQVALLRLSGPAGTQVLAIEDGPLNYVRFRWQAGDQRGQTLVSRDDPASPQLVNGLQVHAAYLKPFLDRSLSADTMTYWVQLAFSPDRIDVANYGRIGGEPVILPPGFERSVPLIFRDRLLLIGDRELADISLASLLRAVTARSRK